MGIKQYVDKIEFDAMKAERDALAAQVVALKYAAEKMMFKGRIVSNVCYNIGQRHEDAEQILQAVREYDAEVRKFHDASSIGPQQHLAEIRAQAVIDFAKYIDDTGELNFGDSNFVLEEAAQYADSIRQGEVK